LRDGLRMHVGTGSGSDRIKETTSE